MPINTKTNKEKAAIKRRQRARIEKGELAEVEKQRETDLMGAIAEMEDVPLEVRRVARQVRRNMGAPLKLRPALAARILHYTLKGNYISTACKAAGVSHGTFIKWMKAADEALEAAEAMAATEAIRLAAEASRLEEAGDEEGAEAARQAEAGLSPFDLLPEDRRLHVHLQQALLMAEAKAEMKLLGKASTGERGWQAQVAILEKRFRDGWGKRSEMNINHGSDPDRPITFSLEAPEERAARVAGILQKAGALDVPGREVLPPEDRPPEDPPLIEAGDKS